jgi:putative transcriptional regulator
MFLYLLKMQINVSRMPTNRLKAVLVEQNKTNKWLAEQLNKKITISRWCSNQMQPAMGTFF